MTIHGAIPRGGYKQQPKRMPRSLGFARHLLRFNGVDQFVDLGTDPRLYPPAFTLSVMLRVLTISAGLPVMGWGDPYIHPVMCLNWTDSIFFYRGWDGTMANGRRWFHSPVNILDKEWHLIELTCPGVAAADINDVKLFADLKEQNIRSTNVGSVVTPMGNAVIARAASLFSNIEVALLLLYNRVLTAEEREYNAVNYHNPIRSGLNLWLPMEEGTGEITYDKSGNGHNGTLLPAGTGPTWERPRQWELRSAVE